MHLNLLQPFPFLKISNPFILFFSLILMRHNKTHLNNIYLLIFLTYAMIWQLLNYNCYFYLDRSDIRHQHLMYLISIILIRQDLFPKPQNFHECQILQNLYIILFIYFLMILTLIYIRTSLTNLILDQSNLRLEK